MRKLQTTVVFLGFGAAVGLGQLTGCSADADDCALNATCNRDGSPFSGDFVVPPPPECSGSPSETPDVIRDECAFFVGGANASDTNEGTEAAPFASLSAALYAAKNAKARVYICGTVNERVDVAAGVSIFGGFDCTQKEWAYDATMRATIAPSAPVADAAFQSSIRISGTGTTRIEDVNIQANAGTFDGGSAIAVIVNDATVDFVRSILTSGDGVAGAKGATPTDDVGPGDPDYAAIRGSNGQIACMGGPNGNPGGTAVINSLCPESVGGKGGNGQEASGAPGDDGLPSDPTYGQGGDGEGAIQCLPGGNGSNGGDGKSGTGAMAKGTLDAAKGFVGTVGNPGEKGAAGQGGGGGGGAKGKPVFYGASGGSGGAGGCPGNGGLGGGPGGSSIGIVSIGGSLRFSEASIVVGSGATGGNGGDGQLGGVGGNGGTGGPGSNCGSGMKTPDACQGGNGGYGGRGGMGGGGRGGHALGVAHTGKTTLDLAGVTIVTGAAGPGGLGADAMGNGFSGLKENTHAFP